MTSSLVLKPLWDNGRCTYAARFRQMSKEEKLEVEQLADDAGFTRADDIWTPPSSGKGMTTFRRALSEAGYALEYDDPEDAPFNLQRLHLTTMTRVRLENLRNFELHDLSGWTPVQAQGEFDGKHFYFRARGSYWRFEVGGNERRTRSPRWWYEEPWPSVTGFEAGYMADEEVVGCLLKAVDLYRNGDNSRFLPDHPDYEHTILDGWSMGAISLHVVTIRLRLSGEEVVRRTEQHGIEVPHTAKWELPYVEKQPVRRLRARSS